MKWIYRLLTFVMLAGAMAFPFFMDTKSGKPVFSMPEAKDLLPSVLTDAAPALPSLPNKQTFYKWKDKNGVWHYGDTPPAHTPEVATIEIDSNTNIIQSIPIETDTPPTPQMSNASPVMKNDEPASNVLTLDRALNVINDAQNVQSLLDNRKAQMDKLGGN